MKEKVTKTSMSKTVKKDRGDLMVVTKGKSKEKSSTTKTMKQKTSCMCGR